MIEIHDHFTHQMRNRLKTIGMGLGLVRLLEHAGLMEEARTTLSLLENGLQRRPEESGMAIQKPYETNRLKGNSSRLSHLALANGSRRTASHGSRN